MRQWLTRWLPGLGLALLAGAACAEPVAWYGEEPAAWFGPGETSGSLNLEVDNSRQYVTTGNSNTRSVNQRYRESIFLNRSNFYVYDPRLLTGSSGLQIGFDQGYNSGSGGVNSSRSGEVIGYNFSADILPRKPYTGSFYANRYEGKSTQSFGGRVEGTYETMGMGLRLKEDGSILNDWGLPWVSAEFNASRQHTQDTTTFLDRSSKRDETRDQVDFTARKGFTTADLFGRYLYTSYQNKLVAGSPFNENHVADVNYSMDFGSGLNHHFDTNLSYTTNGGQLPVDRLVSSTHLQLAHSRDLTGDYSYSYDRATLNRLTTTGLPAARLPAERLTAERHQGTVDLSHQLYTNLTSQFHLIGTYFIAPEGGTVTTEEGQFSQYYRHSLPRNGNLSLNWGVGRGLNTSDLRVASIPVNAERHVAPATFAPGNGFELDRPFVLPGSISVVNVQGGGSPPPLIVGVDYDIVAKGSRTRIEPRFGSFNVAPNDPLEVSYVYQVDPSSKFQSDRWGVGAGVDYGWIGVSYQHSESSETPLKGLGLFLSSSSNDTAQLQLRGLVWDIESDATLRHSRTSTSEFINQIDEKETQLDLHGVWGDYDALANATFNEYRAIDQAYDRRVLSASVAWRARDDLNVVVSANATDLQYLLTSRDDSSRSVRGAVSWNVFDGLTTTGFVDARYHSFSGLPAETVLQMGAHAVFVVGKLSLTSDVRYEQWERAATSSQGMRFNLTVIRSF